MSVLECHRKKTALGAGLPNQKQRQVMRECKTKNKVRPGHRQRPPPTLPPGAGRRGHGTNVKRDKCQAPPGRGGGGVAGAHVTLEFKVLNEGRLWTTTSRTTCSPGVRLKQ